MAPGVEELFVELFVERTDGYVALLCDALGLSVTRDQDSLTVIEGGGTRFLLHVGASDLRDDHVFARPLRDGVRRGVGVEICIGVDDIEAAFGKARVLPQFVVTPLLDQPWGLRDFRVTTPDGYYLRITQPRRMQRRPA